jgi:hypothetical protein
MKDREEFDRIPEIEYDRREGACMMASSRSAKEWWARLLVSSVFIANLTAAIPFILFPARFTHGFEISGIPGEVSVRGLGILFLMWNATYPPVILRPSRYRVLFGIMLAQQLIGLIGETAMWILLPSSHTALSATGLRFILFDGVGLIALGLAFLLSHPTTHAPKT